MFRDYLSLPTIKVPTEGALWVRLRASQEGVELCHEADGIGSGIMVSYESARMLSRWLEGALAMHDAERGAPRRESKR